MGKSYKTKIKEFYLKLKTIKNIEIIIAVIVIALIILLYSLISVNKKNDVKISSAVNEKQEMSLTAEVERKLTEVLSQIDGAGKVKVMITYSSSPEKIIANTKSTHTNTTCPQEALPHPKHGNRDIDNNILKRQIGTLYHKRNNAASSGVIVVAEG